MASEHVKLVRHDGWFGGEQVARVRVARNEPERIASCTRATLRSTAEREAAGKLAR